MGDDAGVLRGMRPRRLSGRSAGCLPAELRGAYHGRVGPVGFAAWSDKLHDVATHRGFQNAVATTDRKMGRGAALKPNGRRAWRRHFRRTRREMRREWPEMIRAVSGLRVKKASSLPLPMPPPRPFAARSLVGMTMGARKRAAYYVAVTAGGPAITVEKLRVALKTLPVEVLRVTVPLEFRASVRAKYRLGQRLRPCGFWMATRKARNNRGPRCGMPLADGTWLDCQHCDGSGVLPAQKHKYFPCAKPPTVA